MKKIGIISEFKADIGTNYGNKFQAYALNNYLNNEFKEVCAYSLSLSKNQKYRFTTFPIPNFIYELYSLIKKIFSKKSQVEKCDLNNRQLLFNSFIINHFKYVYKNVKWKDFKQFNFDFYIVGSDVVWSQNKNVINRIKFLDFNSKKKYYKMSYAASFGRDYIPKENVKFVKKYLSKFNYISVREGSSADMLKKIGIDNVKHVCDPTLLLDKSDWKKIEKSPNLTKKKYIFTYLLGKDKNQRDYIMNFAKDNNLIVINIPYADGRYDEVDETFGDISFNDCSPENWIWLVDNAEYVFTDSFHGLMFSIIFNKKFVVVKRYYDVDINNRIFDFLKKIKQDDKYVDIENDSIERLKWDYDLIDNILDDFIGESKKFLDNILKVMM